MDVIRAFAKPQYLLRPHQVFRRLRHAVQHVDVEPFRTQLPWGTSIYVRRTESIGRSIWHAGVVDLTVTEAIARLTELGDVVIDVGANIGYLTSLMSKCVGAYGEVISFEPHPNTFEILRKNENMWKNIHNMRNVTIKNMALGDHVGMADLYEWDNYGWNSGLSSMVCVEPNRVRRTISVPMVRLDDIVPGDVDVGVLKVDVEGFELEVLKGSARLLKKQRIRDIVFEEHRPTPTLTTSYVESYGYEVFELGSRFYGPVVARLGECAPRQRYEPPNYLATIAPRRAQDRIGKPGWKCLSRRSRPRSA